MIDTPDGIAPGCDAVGRPLPDAALLAFGQNDTQRAGDLARQFVLKVGTSASALSYFSAHR